MNFPFAEEIMCLYKEIITSKSLWLWAAWRIICLISCCRASKQFFNEMKWNLWQMSHLMTKPTKWLYPAKTQISLGIRPVWSESSLCAQWVAKDLSFLHADSEDSDQTGRMPRLIWVFAGRTCRFVGFVMRQLKSCEHFKTQQVQEQCIADPS